MRDLLLCGQSMIVLIATFTVSSAAEETRERELELVAWYHKLQKVPFRVPRNATSAQEKTAYQAYIDAVAEANQDVVLTWAAFVTDVRWKDGIASINFVRPPIKAASKNDPVRLTNSGQFEFIMTEEMALTILPRAKMTFRGKLDFHPGRIVVSGLTSKSQGLFTVRHKKMAGYVGTFTTTEYTCEINGKSVQGRWATAE